MAYPRRLGRSGELPIVTARGPRRITHRQLQELATALNREARRSLLGIVGAPGAGKSTLAEHLAASLRPSPPVVAMDGFHLAQAVIDAKGLTGRKGAPETFDAWGFANLISRLARPEDDVVVYAPRFDRSIEEPVAGSVAARPDDALVIVEGNYLALKESPWDQIRAALDVCMYLELDDETRRRHLVERHMRHGKTSSQAEQFAFGSDENNARLVAATRVRADFIVRADPANTS